MEDFTKVNLYPPPHAFVELTNVNSKLQSDNKFFKGIAAVVGIICFGTIIYIVLKKYDNSIEKSIQENETI